MPSLLERLSVTRTRFMLFTMAIPVVTLAGLPQVETSPATSTEGNLPPGEIVRVGQDAYEIRLGAQIDVAERLAKKRASEYCAGMKKIMVVKYEAFDMGYGYRLTWSCLPPRNSGQDLPPGRVVRAGPDTYKIRVGGPLDIAENLALNRAGEYCARMKKTIAVTYQAFDVDYGYRITWKCLPQP